MKKILVFTLLLGMFTAARGEDVTISGTLDPVPTWRGKIRYPTNGPMFPGMIMRCDPECHWECEFGVTYSTAMVHQNLIMRQSGCEEKHIQGNPLFNIVPGMNFIPT